MPKTMPFIAVAVAVGVLALPSTGSAAIRITRIRYNPPGAESGTNTHLNHEYIVVKNTGLRPRILTDWRIVEGRSGFVFSFPAFRLRAGDQVTIHTGVGDDERADLFWNRDDYAWKNLRDTAVLRNADDLRVDGCGYRGLSDPERDPWRGQKQKC